MGRFRATTFVIFFEKSEERVGERGGGLDQKDCVLINYLPEKCYILKKFNKIYL